LRLSKFRENSSRMQPLWVFFFICVTFAQILSSSVIQNVSSDDLHCPSFPKVALIGVQKAGTTTTVAMLKKCLNLCYLRGELHVFNRLWDIEEINFHSLCQQYQSLHSQEQNCFAIDATPSNAVNPAAAKFFPHTRTKMFGIFRDPIDRLVSSLNMALCSKKGSRADLLESLQSEKEFLFARKEEDRITHSVKNRIKWGRIGRSLYDRVLGLYHLKESERLIFDTLRDNCTTFAVQLAHNIGHPEIVSCLKSQCATHKNIHCEDQTLFVQDDIPPDVKDFLQGNNKWWYSRKKKGTSLNNNLQPK